MRTKDYGGRSDDDEQNMHAKMEFEAQIAAAMAEGAHDMQCEKCEVPALRDRPRIPEILHCIAS